MDDPCSRPIQPAHGTPMRLLILMVLLLLDADAIPASGVPPAAQLCHAAATRAAHTTGVPPEVLRAIALAETGRSRGRDMHPWPWAVNAEGAGRWLASRAEAAAFLRGRLAAGQRNLDIGCFQINYRWHGHAFTSPEAMLEPEANALYAARFLKRLYAEAGDWDVAAGLYHSRTPDLAERYRDRFRRFMARAEASSAGLAGPGPERPPARAAATVRVPLIETAMPIAGSGPGMGDPAPRRLYGSLFAAAASASAVRPLVDLAGGRPR